MDKRIKNIIIIIVIGLLLGVIKKADAQQDAQFSQYMFNGIYINPAYAGYREQLNVQGFFRTQWTGVTGAPQTESVAVDAIANDDKVGLAFMMSDDKLGAQSNLEFYANYAYRIQMNEDGSSRLALGFGVGAVQLGINGAMLFANDPEPYQPTGNQSTILPDARLGAYYSDDKVYVGLSADNLVAQFYKVPATSFIAQPKPHYYLTAGMLVPLSEDIQLKPSFLLKDDMAGPTSLDLTTFIIMKDAVWLGCSYQTGVKLYNKPYLQSNLGQPAAIVLAAQLYTIKNYRIGYSYDISLGALAGYSGGSHELSIGYFFDRKDYRISSPRYF